LALLSPPKSVKTTQTAEERNISKKNTMRTAVKRAKSAIETNADNKNELVSFAIKQLDKAAQSNLTHSNTKLCLRPGVLTETLGGGVGDTDADLKGSDNGFVIISFSLHTGSNTTTTTTVILPNTTTVDFTPTWKTEPKPLSADAVVCNIDDGKSQKIGEKLLPTGTNTNKDASLISPDSDKGSEKGFGQFSKFKSKLASVKRTPTAERHKMENSADDTRSLSPTSSLRSFDGPPRVPERGNLRHLQISNPILQTAVNIKTSLLPVCRENDIITNPLSEPFKSASVSPTPPPRVSVSTPGLKHNFVFEWVKVG
jgi:small subunit ribosomal protein S20